MIIRNEEKKDFEAVEKLTRRAFYNVYVPGCTEHYLIRLMREHEDFIPALDFVLEDEGRIIGNIMYTKATLTDETGFVKNILTFGPVCVALEHQRKGLGKMLMEHSFQAAARLGYDTIVIFGSPAVYVSQGFKSCRKFNVCIEKGILPAAMMVKELIPGALDGRRWLYQSSPVMAISEDEANAYDDTLEHMEKKYQLSQDEFYIMSHSFVQD